MRCVLDTLWSSKGCVEHFRQTDYCMYIGMPNLFGNILKWFKRALCKSVICRWSESNCYLQYGESSAVGLTRQIVALKIGSSNLVSHPKGLAQVSLTETEF